VSWFRKAAEQGHAHAQYNLGVTYAEGKGIAQDYVAAVKWWRLAAEQGDSHAQFNLGLTYTEGRGVSQDYVQAHMWFNLAAAEGIEMGRKKRDIIAKNMTPADISKAQRLAREWLEEHGV
jgi:TPR repeat protein